MRHVFPKLVPPLLLLSLWLLVGTAAPAATMAAQLTATWTQASTDVAGFKVERATGTTGTFSQIATPNVTSYTDTNLAPGTTYCYRVRAYNAAGDSGYSNTDCGTTAASQNFTLTVTTSGTGSGTVSSNPAGITCGTTCSASYANGTAVTLTATPATGSAFSGWSGGCTGTGSCTIVANANTSVTATYTATAPSPPLITGGLVAAYGLKALDFTGSSVVQVTGAALNNIIPFTYCARVYPRSQGGSNDGRILHKGTNTARKQLQTDSGLTNSLALYVDRTGGAAQAVSALNGLTLNQWQFVCGTYSEGDGPRLYLNGTEMTYSIRTIGNGATMDDAGDQLFIGNRGTLDEGWDGLIDEVRIYNRVLTLSEIQTVMTTPVGTLP